MKPVVRMMKSVNARVSVIATAAALSTLAVAGVFATTAQANEFGDVATVISSTPIFERVSVPRQQCYTEQVASYEERRVNRVVYDEDRRDDSRDSRDYSAYNNGSNRGIGAGTVLGAVIGGAIGHQFGHSSGGRDRGTAVGAILGGIVGNSAENDNRNYRDASYRNNSTRQVVDVDRVPVTRDVQRCQTISDTRDEVRGYDVRYRYQGREYNTRLPYDPGPTMQVNVEVRPVSRGLGGGERYEARPDARYESRSESRAPRPTYLRSY